MPIGSSDGMYYEDDFDRAQGVGKPIRPQILITKEQPRTDDPIGTFIENELGRTQAPMPRPDPRGSRPTYEEGDTIPGSDSYGNQPLGGPEYKRPLLPAPDDQSNTPLYNPERDSLTPPSMSKVSDSDLSLSPEGSSQDASQSHINDRTRDLSMRDMVREGANWIKSKTGIGERSFVGDFVQGLKDNGEVIGKFLRGEISKEDPEFTKAVVGLTSDLGLGGVTTAPLRAANSAGIFGGRLGASKAGNVELKRLDEAFTRIEKQDPSEVYQKTGWWKDARDGQWKFEIQDTGANLDKSVLDKISKMAEDNVATGSKVSYVKVPLEKVFNHPDLYKAYPELKNADFYFDQRFTNALGTAGISPQTGKLSVAVGPLFYEQSANTQKGIILHEIQHLVQTLEGFASGGRPNYKARDTLKQIGHQLASDYKDLTSKGWENLSSEEKKKLTDLRIIGNKIFVQSDESGMKAFRDYQNIPGEIEARNVDSRDSLRSMGIEERLIGHPSNTEKFNPTALRETLDKVR